MACLPRINTFFVDNFDGFSGGGQSKQNLPVVSLFQRDRSFLYHFLVALFRRRFIGAILMVFPDHTAVAGQSVKVLNTSQ